MIAAKYMNKDIAEILIKKIIEFKINLNIRNKKGKTALHYAAKKVYIYIYIYKYILGMLSNSR